MFPKYNVPNPYLTPPALKEIKKKGSLDLYSIFPELMPIANRLADAQRGATFSGQGVYREVSARRRESIKWALGDEVIEGVDEEALEGLMEEKDWRYESEDEVQSGGEAQLLKSQTPAPEMKSFKGPMISEASLEKLDVEPAKERRGLRRKSRSWRRALCNVLD